MNILASAIQKIYKERFTEDPSLFFSPGRINIIGEHIDYNDGFVMPAAINKGIYYAIALNGSNDIQFYATDVDEYYHTTVATIHKESSWKNYVLSVLNQFQKIGIELKGFNCVFGGDIPIGSGLSSSAAVEGGLAFAVNELLQAGLSRKDLALLCQRAEHDYPGVKCGIMDQFANMMGKKGEVILLDCRSLEHHYFPIQLDGWEIVLVNTKVHHSLAGGEYNKRRKNCEEGLKILQTNTSIQSFRDVKDIHELLPFKTAMGEEVYQRCLFVVEEIKRTQSASACLQQNDILGLGKLMYATHVGLSELYDVSCKELDWLVDYAQQNKAIAGARMMGGGFGGCTINIIQKEAVAEFTHAVSTDYLEKFGRQPEVYVVETSDGVTAL
ncbi:MAG: galactokinase [Ferruginibacter sp.]